MLDLVRAAAILYALVGCWRARFAIGGLVGLGIAAILVGEIGAPLVHHPSGEAGVGSAFALALLGPSALAPRVLAPLSEALLAGVVSAWSFARASVLRPESAIARAWDAVGLQFTFVAILDAMLVVFDLMLARLMHDG